MKPRFADARLIRKPRYYGQFALSLGKCGSRCHSTTSFSENVEVAETSYQTSEVLAFRDRDRV